MNTTHLFNELLHQELPELPEDSFEYEGREFVGFRFERETYEN